MQRGDIVEVVANSAYQKGMPHKFYHGRTGIVYNVTKRAVGVEVNKQLRGKILVKRINVRVEHVRHSKCRQEFLDRVQRNDTIKRAAKKSGKPCDITEIKRFPVQPKAGYVVKAESSHGLPTMCAPVPFGELETVDGAPVRGAPSVAP